MRALTISNQKGGVAKTTTAISLAGAFAESGHRVLACDLDPQGNLTLGLGVEPDGVERGTLEVLLGDLEPGAALLRGVSPGVDLLPATLALAAAERRLLGEVGFDEVLKRRLAPLRADYDVAIIDSPPSLGLLTLNAIGAADAVLVPVQCEVFSARGLGQLLEVAALVRERRNPALSVAVLATLVDRRNRVCKDILEELRASFGAELLEAAIGVDTRLREAAAAGQPVTRFAPSARAAEEYRAVARELVARGVVQPATAAAPASAAKTRRAGGGGSSRRAGSSRSAASSRAAGSNPESGSSRGRAGARRPSAARAPRPEARS